MQNTPIEWTTHSWNPWTGCSKVSPGCVHCYAEGWAKRSGLVGWGSGVPRRRTGESYWKQPLKWNREDERSRVSALHSWPAGKPMPWHRPRVFCASLADWLDHEVPTEWLSDLLCLIVKTPFLDWQLLTKRPANWRPRMEAVAAREDMGAQVAGQWLAGIPPANVWLGATVEDQARADERIPILLSIPARIRFLSCEPLLGPVDLLIGGECSSWKCPACGSDNIETDIASDSGKWWKCDGCGATDYGDADWKPDIHWIICGGESGPRCRPMDIAWARSLRDQCAAAGVPFFMKQIGGPHKPFPPIPPDLTIRQFPSFPYLP